MRCARLRQIERADLPDYKRSVRICCVAQVLSLFKLKLMYPLVLSSEDLASLQTLLLMVRRRRRGLGLTAQTQYLLTTDQVRLDANQVHASQAHATAWLASTAFDI